jgi:hypothetical protein
MKVMTEWGARFGRNTLTYVRRRKSYFIIVEKPNGFGAVDGQIQSFWELLGSH